MIRTWDDPADIAANAVRGQYTRGGTRDELMPGYREESGVDPLSATETFVALRLDAGGRCTIASAGHPAPFLNDKEMEIPGALPLGIDPNFKYEEKQIQIVPGDRCALYTDGLLEARSPDGEIFSFERLQELFATAPDAAKASEAAVSFGQEDDITVLTLTRTGDA